MRVCELHRLVATNVPLACECKVAVADYDGACPLAGQSGHREPRYTSLPSDGW
jgi:hypothetical protein